MRTSRLVVGTLALLLLGLTAFHLSRSVSATAIAGGPTWPCGSVARPALPASTGLASATPEEGRRTFVLDEVACSAARDRQLSRAVRSLLPALALGAVFVATTGAKKSVAEPATPVVA